MSGPRTVPESALGRYLPEGATGPLVPVQLLRVPVRLLLAAREHHDGLVRELRLLSLQDLAGTPGTPARLVELVDELGTRHASAQGRRDDELEAALARGEEAIDLLEHVPAEVADVVQTIDALIEECERFCEQGHLMTLPRPPVVRRFSQWYLSQYREQVLGRAPTPWDGPLRLSPPSG